MSLPDYTQLQEAYDKKLEDELDKYPVCDDCHHHITDEDLYIINDKFVCEECLKDYYKFKTDNYIKDY